MHVPVPVKIQEPNVSFSLAESKWKILSNTIRISTAHWASTQKCWQYRWFYLWKPGGTINDLFGGYHRGKDHWCYQWFHRPPGGTIIGFIKRYQKGTKNTSHWHFISSTLMCHGAPSKKCQAWLSFEHLHQIAFILADSEFCQLIPSMTQPVVM